jgi:PD-(D/E)XK nuclease superfamily
VGNCPAAPRIEGLLNFVPRQPTVRKVTATDLRTYASCPRRYQLLTLQGLPGEQLAGEALQRGQILDVWLNVNHMRDLSCNESDVQRLLTETGDQAIAAMASQHLGICPKADPEVSGLTTQAYVAALDATSRILLVGRPDAIYLRDSCVVWRETKTHTTLTPRSAEQLIETDIAAALYLVLLGSGAAGTPDVLEWEELSSNGHELTTLPADDEDLAEAARSHVSAAVADLIADSAYAPRIGVGCTQCPVRGWCPDAP